MPVYRKDDHGFYQVFTEAAFKDSTKPNVEFARYFDQRGRDGVAVVDDCLKRTQPATEEEYDREKSRYFL